MGTRTDRHDQLTTVEPGSLAWVRRLILSPEGSVHPAQQVQTHSSSRARRRPSTPPCAAEPIGHHTRMNLCPRCNGPIPKDVERPTYRKHRLLRSLRRPVSPVRGRVGGTRAYELSEAYPGQGRFRLESAAARRPLRHSRKSVARAAASASLRQRRCLNSPYARIRSHADLLDERLVGRLHH